MAFLAPPLGIGNGWGGGRSLPCVYGRGRAAVTRKPGSRFVDQAQSGVVPASGGCSRSSAERGPAVSLGAGCGREFALGAAVGPGTTGTAVGEPSDAMSLLQLGEHALLVE